MSENENENPPSESTEAETTIGLPTPNPVEDSQDSEPQASVEKSEGADLVISAKSETEDQEAAEPAAERLSAHL